MITSFLKAKHWQLFTLTTGIPIILYIGFMVTIFSQISENPDTANPFEIFNFFKWFPLIMLFILFFHLGWIWSIEYGLQKYVPQNITLKIKRFKILFFIPVIYLLLINTFLFLTFTDFENNIPPFSPFIMLFIIPLHLLSMFCLFHNLYFCAKTIKTIELKREVSFNDYIGEFFLMWFNFIGIWILQPRINNIISQEKES
ncbi:hypothetical protein ACFS5J_11790 [Flavobacterium chuncheonense]|uniref:Uncharacterized protein n=1 Tax=Flavobacterium chuncheonense TaxID=2026653 RepID=A0ABW5YPI7_9FLAO